MRKQSILLVVLILLGMNNAASASMVQGIDIDFVSIGFAGNAADTQVMDDGTTWATGV